MAPFQRATRRQWTFTARPIRSSPINGPPTPSAQHRRKDSMRFSNRGTRRVTLPIPSIAPRSLPKRQISCTGRWTSSTPRRERNEPTRCYRSVLTAKAWPQGRKRESQRQAILTSCNGHDVARYCEFAKPSRANWASPFRWQQSLDVPSFSCGRGRGECLAVAKGTPTQTRSAGGSSVGRRVFGLRTGSRVDARWHQLADQVKRTCGVDLAQPLRAPPATASSPGVNHRSRNAFDFPVSGPG